MKFKILICSMLTIVFASLFLLITPAFVKAADTVSDNSEETVVSRTYNCSIEVATTTTLTMTFNFKFTTDGSYYLMWCAFPSSYGDNDYYQLFWYNPSTGESLSASSLNNGYPDGVSVSDVNYYYSDDPELKTMGVTNFLRGSLMGISNGLVSSNLPVYGLSLSQVPNFDTLYADGLIPIMGYDYWLQGNRYTYNSIYSPEVLPPELRQFNFCQYSDKSTAFDYIITLSYIIPGAIDVDDYYTEIWVDIPIGVNSAGVVSFEKKFVTSIKTSELFKEYTIQVQNPDGGWTSQHVGWYYYLYTYWNKLIPFLSAQELSSYGQVTFYMRHAIYSDDVSLVSDYCYCTVNTSDTYIEDDKYVPAVPDIYKGAASTFDEDNPGIHDETNSEIDNSANMDYVTGNTDVAPEKPSSSSNKFKYNYTGKWSIEDFESWVSSGFGLLGEGGLLSIIGDLFYFLPSEFMHFLFWMVVIIGIIFVIRLT